MAETALPSGVKAEALNERVRSGPKWRRKLGAIVLPGYTHLVILWLFAPIIVMVIFGFNDTRGRLNIVWSGFTLKWFADPFGVTALTTAVYTSLLTATLGALISTVMGTMIALAAHRYSFRGRALLDAVMVMNIAASEVVMGAALLTLFIAANIPLGILTIVIAQVMFSIPFVAITVRARLVGFDSSLEEAAQDLGATPLTTFLLVTLPIIFPGVLAAALLAFALCLDDYVITSFVAGNVQTFPLWVYGATRLGVPPQVNVIGTFIFLSGAILAVGFAALQGWRSRRLARESAL
ncbi:MAG TPA: ABC transporter permease [Candidatus Dormibacteraeota bacterium]